MPTGLSFIAAMISTVGSPVRIVTSFSMCNLLASIAAQRSYTALTPVVALQEGAEAWVEVDRCRRAG
jgi:hypothetical protein